MKRLTSVHSPQHTRDEAVDAVALLDLWDQSRDSTLVVGRAPEVSKDELLERVDTVLKVHQVHDGFETEGASMCVQLKLEFGWSRGGHSPFIGVVYTS